MERTDPIELETCLLKTVQSLFIGIGDLLCGILVEGL